MQQNSTQRLLEYAAERLGQAELAHRLTATQGEVLKWMAGAAMPPRKALALADLIALLGRN